MNSTIIEKHPSSTLRLAANARIREAFERKVKVITARPFIASGTANTHVRLDRNLQCTITDGDWTLGVDMHSNYAGDNSGPNPGVLARGALGSCLAIGYAMWAARLGVVFDKLEVHVEADYDAQGEFAVDDTVDPGYLAIRYNVRVESTASEAEVLGVLDATDRYSSIRDVFTRSIPVERTVEYSRTELS